MNVVNELILSYNIFEVYIMNKKFKLDGDFLCNLIIIILLIHTFIYIFKLSNIFMTGDSAFILDYSLEQIRTKSIFPVNWVNTHDIWIYSLIPMVTLFLRVGFNLLISRQLAVLIQTIIFLILLKDLFKNVLGYKKEYKLFIIMILSGISGQLMFELFGDATYTTIIMYMVLGLYLYLKYIKTNNKKYMIFLNILLLVLCSLSMRFPIYITAPLVICMIYKIYEKGFNKKEVIPLISILLSSLLGLIIFKLLSTKLIISTLNTDNGLITIPNDISLAIHQLVYYWFELFGSTNVSLYGVSYTYTYDFLSSSSPFIVFTFLRFIAAVLTLIIPFVLIKKFNKMNEEDKILFLYSISFTILTLFFMLIARMYVWYRYAFPVIFFLLMLYMPFYRYVFTNKKTIKNITLFSFIIALFSVSSLFMVYNSYFDITHKSFRENYYQGVTNYLVKNNLEFGYVVGTIEPNAIRYLSDNKIILTKIDFKYNEYDWLVSKDWYKTDFYNGKTFFLKYHKDDIDDYVKEKADETLHYGEYDIFIYESHERFKEIIDKVKR